jgi:predicted TIM-barrel fold metal-dependent hydrolase
MSPGPKSSALRPDRFIAEAFAPLDATAQRKILHDNAARLYNLE